MIWVVIYKAGKQKGVVFNCMIIDKEQIYEPQRQ